MVYVSVFRGFGVSGFLDLPDLPYTQEPTCPLFPPRLGSRESVYDLGFKGSGLLVYSPLK